MLVSQVDIPRMFHSYTALTEDSSLSGYTIQCARCGQEFRIPARRNACAPVHVFCPSCREYINYGWSRAAEDNAWVAHGEAVPTDMHLQRSRYTRTPCSLLYGDTASRRSPGKQTDTGKAESIERYSALTSRHVKRHGPRTWTVAYKSGNLAIRESCSHWQKHPCCVISTNAPALPSTSQT